MTMIQEAGSETVASHLWKVLSAYGVDICFGLPGITTLPPMEAMRRSGDVRFVLTRHEQCAGHMADATARLGAPFGAVLVDLGPGLANTLTAVLTAYRDSSPVLVIAGNEERALIGREVWHEMPEIEVFRSVTHYCERVEREDEFPRMLESAIRAATTGRPGPALLSVPKDIWDSRITPMRSRVLPATLPRPDDAAVRAAAQMVSSAHRPLIVAGGGVNRGRGREEVQALCENWQLPLVTSPNGRGALPEDHPLCLGHAGRFGQRQASAALAEADLLLVLGCRLDDLTTHNWSLLNQDQRLIQIDVEGGKIGQNWPVDLAVVSDAGAFADALARLAPSGKCDFWDVSARVKERVEARAAFFAIDHPVSVKPQAMMKAVEQRAGPNHTVIMGGGRYQQFAGEWLVRQSENFFYPANAGTVGFALSASIGAAIARPDRQVICLVGDGDFAMHCQELETARREGANLKIVIFNDFAFGAMLARQASSFGTEYGNAEFVTLAKAFGVGGRAVDRGDEVGEAADWLFAQEGVALLDVRIDKTENRSLLFGHDIGAKT